MTLYKITAHRVINLEAFTGWQFFPEGRQPRLTGWTGNETESEGPTVNLVGPEAELAWAQLQALCTFDAQEMAQ